VLDTSTSFGPASALTRAPMCTAVPPMSSPRTSHDGVQSGTHLDAEGLHRVTNCRGGADRSLRAVEHRQEAVARRVHLAAPKPRELRPDDGVVRIKQGMPVAITQRRLGASSPRCR
jgi:hypothetical protein